MKPVHWLSLALGVGVLSGLFYFGDAKRRLHSLQETPAPSPIPSRNPISAEAARQQIMNGSADGRASAEKRREQSRHIVEKLGKGFAVEYSPEGQLLAITGKPRPDEIREADFKPSSSDQVAKRSRELMKELLPALGLAVGTRLGEPRVQPGEVSAQVYFQQTQEGVPIAPFGSVTLLLGPAGEILRVDNSSLSELHVEGDAKLSISEARLAAGAAASRIVEGGEQVVWATSSTGAARPAYQFESQGRQIVIDASSGKVILNRDRRMR